MTLLNSSTLSTFADRVAVPEYDRSALVAGIVHFGVGGFHRAHQAVFIDRLLSQGLASDWAICGVGVLEGDRRMKEVMDAQDGLYSLVLKHPDGSFEPRVIGSIVEYLFAPDDPEVVIERLASESTRIVSLTITEGGYNVDYETGEFDLEDVGVARDLERSTGPATVFGLVVEAIIRRKERGMVPFTVMSCDNIQGNGHAAKLAFSAYADARELGLGDWVRENVSFPNSMVDRITPVTIDADREHVREAYGSEDAWPVVAEPFIQWVLEDNFSAGRPEYNLVGVQLVDDVEPYELMKLRLLNASHQAMCYFGYLAGHRYAHEAAADPIIASFLRRYMDREGAPTLQPVPGIDLDEYKTTLIERFSNPEVRDTLARLCAESSDRIPKWLVPVIRQNLAVGGDIRLSAAIVASWARYAEAVDEQGAPIEVVDRLKDSLVAIAQSYPESPDAFLANRSVFGDLIDEPRFVAAYRWALESLHEHGASVTLEELVSSRDV